MVSEYLGAWFLFTLINILSTAEVSSEIQCRNGDCEPGLLLGLLRRLPETAFPKLSHDDQLQECREEASEKSKTHSESILTLLNESRNVTADFQNAIQKGLTDQTRSQKLLEDKMRDNQKLRQDLLAKELLLSKKFDCKASEFTVDECRRFCDFPYSYSTCASKVKREFVMRLINTEIGSCCWLSTDCCISRASLQISQNTVSKSLNATLCLEVHVVVK